ncbi:MAG: lipopolysaccharide biosynthesis protein [Cytophagales bacterium]|nr:lipopolysaccharide biosynthesis protein [Cytophagales bacterium]
MSTIKHKIIAATKWSAFSEVVARAASPVIFILLARLLTPEDYGVAALATIVISFAQVVGEAGMGKALVQRETDIEAASNVVFWLNLGIGCVLYAIIYAFAPLFAASFGDPRVTLILQVQGLQIITTCLYTVPLALSQRTLDFKTLFWVRFITIGISGVTSIALALAGFSYWSLVISALVSSILQCIVLWYLTAWRPTLRFEKDVARSVFRFGRWILGEGLLGWFYLWADSIVIGYFLSSHDLGLYRTGSLFVSTAYTIIFSPVMTVLFSGLSRMQNDASLFKRYFVYCNKLTILIALPIAVTFFCVPDLFAAVLFGDKWQGIGMVIMVTGLAQGLSWTINSNAEAFRAIGRADLSSKIMGAGFLYYLPAYIISSMNGLDAFLWTRLGLVCVTLPIYYVVTRRVLHVGLRQYFGDIKYLILGAVAMGVTTWVVLHYQPVLSVRLLNYLVAAAAGGAVYLLFLIPYKGFITSTILSFTRKEKLAEVPGE